MFLNIDTKLFNSDFTVHTGTFGEYFCTITNATTFTISLFEIEGVTSDSFLIESVLTNNNFNFKSNTIYGSMLDATGITGTYNISSAVVNNSKITGNMVSLDNCDFTNNDSDCENNTVEQNIFSTTISGINTLDFHSKNNNIPGKMFDVTNGHFTNDDFTVRNNHIRSSLYNGTNGNVQRLRIMIDSSNVTGDVFSITSGDFNNTYFNITNNNISTSVLIVTGLNAHVLYSKVENNQIGADLVFLDTCDLTNSYLTTTNNYIGRTFVEASNSQITTIGEKGFDLSNGLLTNMIMNVNDVEAGSGYCNADNVDVTSPTIDFLYSKFGGDLFQIKNRTFANTQFNFKNVVNGTMLYVTDTYANLKNATIYNNITLTGNNGIELENCDLTNDT